MNNTYTKHINEDLWIACESFSNSRNWGHKARVYYKNELVEEKKIIYYNRTWERYIYESIMLCLVDRLDNRKAIPLSDRIAMYKCIKESNN